MKNTVKILAIVLIFLINYNSFAQTFGVKAGLNLANTTFKDDRNKADGYIMRPGFNAGLMVDIPLVKNISLQPGIIVSQKGYKWNKNTSNVSLFYAQIPVTANYKFDVGKVKVYPEAGPYFAVGLGGKYKNDISGVKESGDIKFGKDEDLKLLDIGLRFGAGLEISSFQIGMFYDLGLSNISHDDTDGFKMTNKVLGFTFGYWFGSNK